MSEVEFIEKDKTNEFHNYQYASEQAIKQTIHPLLVKHGVLFTLSCLESTNVGEITTAKFTYHFYDVESGEELTGCFVGQGQDKGDKGIYKAITGAIKYILTSTFLIPTGLDPESEEPVRSSQRSSVPLPEPPDYGEPPESGSGSCPQCGKPLRERKGKFGPFMGCSNFPTCKFILKK